MDEYYRAVRALPAWLARPLSALPPGIAEQVHEIRLRVGCGVQLTIGGKPCCPAELPALQKLRLTPLQMEEIFVTLCGWPDSFTAHRGRAPSCRSCAR